MATNPFGDLFAPDPLPAAPAAAPVRPPQAAMPAMPQVPNVGTPPFVPSPAPAFTPPRVDMNQPRRQGPNFVEGVMPIVAAMIAGGKDPAAIGVGLASFLEGKRLRDRERMDQQTAQRKEQAEAADFYSRALSQAQTIDDPVAFEQWQHAIRPIAQLHGINVAAFTFNDKAAMTRAQKQARELLEKLDKEHPDGNYTAEYVDAKGQKRRGTRAEIARLAGLAAFDQQGNPLAPSVKPQGVLHGDTPEKAHLIAFAKKRGKSVDQLNDAEIKQATKEFRQSDDRPVDPALAEIRALTAANLRAAQQNGGLSPGQFNQAKSLADDFTRDVKDYTERRRAYQTVLSAADNPAGDVSLIFAFMKMLDPGSVVRENEYATAQNAAGIPDRIRNAYNAAVDGRRLNGDQRTQFTAQAQEIYNGAKGTFEDMKVIYDDRATAQGIDPKFVTFTLPDPGTARPARRTPTTTTPGATTPKVARVGERRTINGQLAVWDGKGWKAVAQ